MTPPQIIVEKIEETKEKILEVLHKKKAASKASLSKISNFVKQAIVELRKEGKIFVEKNNIILVEKDEKEENMRKKENVSKPDPAKQSGHGMVEIASIKVGDRMRSLNQEEVAHLAESIKEIDLLNPIVVDADMNLIAGYHRLEACKLLGWTKIKATISNLGSLEKELAEIDENLIRNELSAFERSEHLGKRKEIYEKLHPETKVGQSQAIAMNQKLGYNVDEIISSTLTPTFTEDTSKKLGVTQRTVQQEISIAKNLSPEAKDFVINNGLANKKTALLEIAKAAPEKQIEIAQKLASGSTVKAIKEQSTAAQELKKKKGELEAEILKLRSELYKVQCEKARLEKDVAYWKQQADEMHKFLGESMKKNDQLKEQLEEKYKAQQTQDFQAAQGWESPAQVEQVEPEEEDLVPPEGVHRPPMEGSNFMPEESYKDEDDDYDYKDN